MINFGTNQELLNRNANVFSTEIAGKQIALSNRYCHAAIRTGKFKKIKV